MGDVAAGAPKLLVVSGLVAEARIAEAPRTRIVCSGGVAALAEEGIAAALREGAVGVLSFGIAGGLAPGLPTGAIVLGDSIVSASDRFFCDSIWLQRLANKLPMAARAPIFGAGAPVATPEDKAQLAAATGAVAVDMESHIAARCAARSGIPFAAIRVICDPAEHALPPAALVGMRADGKSDIFAVLRSLATTPSQLPSLVRTALDAKRAFDQLKRCRRILDDDFCFFL